jgi:catechol 2,3-dioxygenase-like lactoylglutathione lyase family enzyme
MWPPPVYRSVEAIERQSAMSDQQIQKVKVTRLAHVGLWTSDVAAQTRFYRQVMGFDLRAAEPGIAGQELEFEDANVFLSLGNEGHCLGLFSETRQATGNSRVSGLHTRLHHLAFEVDTNAELAAFAARLKQSGVEITLGERDSYIESSDTLWFNDPDNNRVGISVAPDDAFTLSTTTSQAQRMHLRPHDLQHLALQTSRLEIMVEFYTEALGFDISDWLLRESVWLRCNDDHHTLMLTKGKSQNIDHIGYSIPGGSEVLAWADYLAREQTSILWGPGRHGAGNDLFLRFADADGNQIELSAELQQYHDQDATTPPRLWHSRPAALNLWGVMPGWVHEEVRV